MMCPKEALGWTLGLRHPSPSCGQWLAQDPCPEYHLMSGFAWFPQKTAFLKVIRVSLKQTSMLDGRSGAMGAPPTAGRRDPEWARWGLLCDPGTAHPHAGGLSLGIIPRTAETLWVLGLLFV